MIRFSEEVHNIVERVYKMAQFHPDETALILSAEAKWTYREVQKKTESLRKNLRLMPLKKRERVLVLFPFDEKFVFLILALFAEGLVPVIIDPRVPRKRWKKLLKVGSVQRIFLTNKIKKWRFLAWWMNSFELISVDSLFASPNTPEVTRPIDTKDTDEVLVTLTSGTTGSPKIVSRNFGVLKNQQFLSCKYLPAVSRDVHLALYGIGVLQSLAEGACTVLLPTQMQNVEQILETIQNFQVTRLSGPPGLLTDFLHKVEQEKIQLPLLENLITGGAPLPRWWFQKAKKYLPTTQVTLLYGSTECEPISILSSDSPEEHPGYPVNLPIPELEITREPFAEINGDQIFEIILCGPNCVPNSPDGLRTGDLAIEKNDLLWLLGRKSEALGKVPIALLEEPLERVSGIKRVAITAQEDNLRIYFETLPEANVQETTSLLQIRAQELTTQYGFSAFQLQQRQKIPVDPRHGWKIQRSELARSR